MFSYKPMLGYFNEATSHTQWPGSQPICSGFIRAYYLPPSISIQAYAYCARLRVSRRGDVFPVRASAQGSLCVLQTEGLTTSKILRGLGGFPELQIPRSQNIEFEHSILPGLCSISPLIFLKHVFLRVATILCKIE